MFHEKGLARENRLEAILLGGQCLLQQQVKMGAQHVHSKLRAVGTRGFAPERIAWKLPCWAASACFSSGMMAVRMS